MLCSCCVALIFASVYERSARCPSLGLMLAAPALNPVALILTFILFDYRIGAVRLGTGIAAVFFTGMIADRMFAGTSHAPWKDSLLSKDHTASEAPFRIIINTASI
jgi:uncharacterized membrane protein YraQ (UPF0718 family)